MKKNIFLITIISVIVVLLVVSFNIDDKPSKSSTKLSSDPETIMANAQKESEAVSDKERKELPQISVSEYLDLYSKEENTLVLVARPTCNYCAIAEPILENLAYTYNLEINYLNTDEFTDDTENDFLNSDDYLKDGEFGTPLLLNVGNNSIIDKVDGLTDTAHYIKFFKDNKYIK